MTGGGIVVVTVVVVNCSQGFAVVPAIRPYGVSTQGGVVGPAVVGGAGVVTGGGIVGGGVILNNGGGPNVGKCSKLSSGKPGKPGSGFAGAKGSGGGGPGRGGGGGGPQIGGCAGAGMVVVGSGHAKEGAPPPHGPETLPWQLQPPGMPFCLLIQPRSPSLALLRCCLTAAD